jgi:hypothetical protein
MIVQGMQSVIVATPDRPSHTAQFGQPGQTDPRYGPHACHGSGNIGVAGPLGRDARPVQAGRMRPALDIRFRGQRLRSLSAVDD